ncbi:MAG: calcium/sodium antiporter [Euryarchaeota archaeon]|nr:calcium/sodium antiporter [Euryarchaeota archaeon]
MRWKLVLFLIIAGASFPLYYLMLQNYTSVYLLLLNFGIGVYLLVDGSDYFVDGAASIAAHLKVSEHTIGLTIVALATSLPEMAVSDIASFYGHPETSWGNAVGSNIANIGLVLGIAAIIMPLALSKYIKRDAITLALVTGLLLFFVYVFRAIFWWMGVVFVVIYLVYLNDIHGRKEEVEEIKPEKSMLFSTLFTVFGALGIVWGANVLVDSAVGISHIMGIPEVIIAATAIAVGTSLPELATTVSATLKKKHGIAVGNIIGSNIFNTLIVMGTAALIHPITLKPESLLTTSMFLGIMTLSLLLFTLRRKLGKLEGVAFLVLYALFLTFLVI